MESLFRVALALTIRQIIKTIRKQRRLGVVFERSGSSELYGFNLLSQDHGRGSPYPTQGHGSGGGR